MFLTWEKRGLRHHYFWTSAEVAQDANFETMAAVLRLATGRKFPADVGGYYRVHIVAKPSRFYSCGFYTPVCKVIAPEKHNRDSDSGGDSNNFGPLEAESLCSSPLDMLYENNGVYGSFLNRMFEAEAYVPTLIPVDSKSRHGAVTRGQGKHPYSIWGPICDSFECVADRATLPYRPWLATGSSIQIWEV